MEPRYKYINIVFVTLSSAKLLEMRSVSSDVLLELIATLIVTTCAKSSSECSSAA